jgi:PAB1-binding protein PBP1
MEEVRERNLVPWLNTKKAEGYSIVGLEQATNSVQLGKFEFPEKSVIVLGIIFD